jgi:hypothetical protein
VRDPRVDYDDGTTIGEAQERFSTFECLLYSSFLREVAQAICFVSRSSGAPHGPG